MRRNRRTFVAAIGTALGTALAGCTGNGGEGGGNGGTGTENGTSASNRTGTSNQTGAGNESTTGDEIGAVNQTQTSDKLKIVSHSFYETDTGRGVRGTVKNVSDQRITYGEVKVTPIDADSAGEGMYYADTQSANIDSLKPGETWEFDVKFRETNKIQNLRRYEIWTTAQTGSQGGG